MEVAQQASTVTTTASPTTGETGETSTMRMTSSSSMATALGATGMLCIAVASYIYSPAIYTYTASYIAKYICSLETAICFL